MTPTEVALTAAFGASFLTGIASLGVIWVQEWRRQKAKDRDALRAAANDLLFRSLAVATRARALGDMMKFRSGLKEGFDIAMRHRKLVDGLELHDWMAQDAAPMHAALAEIWTRDNQEGIRLANDVVSKCMDLLSASTAMQSAEGWQRLRLWAAGERWTPELTKGYDDALRELAHTRRRYADHVRARFGLDAVELFTLAEPNGKPKAIERAKSALAVTPPADRRRIWHRRRE